MTIRTAVLYLLAAGLAGDASAQYPHFASGGQNEVGVFALGNFNPTYPVYLGRGQEIVGSSESTLGGAAEFRRFFGSYATGLLYMQDASRQRLWVPQGCLTSKNMCGDYGFPAMRWNLAVLETEPIKSFRRWQPFLQEGPGVLVTNGYANCGWTGALALVVGAGVDYTVTHRLSLRAGETFTVVRQGCYRDPTCHAPAAVEQDTRIGAFWHLGGTTGERH